MAKKKKRKSVNYNKSHKNSRSKKKSFINKKTQKAIISISILFLFLLLIGYHQENSKLEKALNENESMIEKLEKDNYKLKNDLENLDNQSSSKKTNKRKQEIQNEVKKEVKKEDKKDAKKEDKKEETTENSVENLDSRLAEFLFLTEEDKKSCLENLKAKKSAKEKEDYLVEIETLNSRRREKEISEAREIIEELEYLPKQNKEDTLKALESVTQPEQIDPLIEKATADNIKLLDESKQEALPPKDESPDNE